MPKMLFIINPFAGMRKANRYLADIIAVFNRADYQVRVHVTASQGDAGRIAKQCAAEVDVVVCAGGDGTFSEMVNGMMRLQRRAGKRRGYAHRLYSLRLYQRFRFQLEAAYQSCESGPADRRG